jgi:Tol biopolymer transport system component
MPLNKRVVIGTAVALLLVTGLAACRSHVLKGPATAEEKAFLASLPGEIVYADRDEQGISNIYKINANGTNKKLLYRNDMPEHNQNSFDPRWSEDGMKIYFTAMKDGEWRRFVMDADGGNVELAEKPDINPISPLLASRESDIIVQLGDVFWKDAEGGLHKVYDYPFHAENDSASRCAHWSPDRRFIIFVTALHNIMVVNREGTMLVKITDGEDPDWKY